MDVNSIHASIEGEPVRRVNGSTSYLAPTTALESQLCGLWQKLLRVEKVGMRDNFFELGGHSLLAVRLFAEIEKITGRKLPLVTLFQAPTLEQLAAILGKGGTETEKSLLVPIQPKGNRPPLFLVHGAGGDVLWGYANLAAHLPQDQPVYGIKSRGQAGLEEWRTLEEMALGYLQEVRKLQPTGPYCLGGYCFGGNVAYEMARQLHSQGETVALLALLDSAPANAGYEDIIWWKPSYSYKFARNVYYWWSDFSQLDMKTQGRFVVRKARALGRKMAQRFRKSGNHDCVDIEDVIDPVLFPENELNMWKIHLGALTEHVQKPYAGPAILFRTRGQPLFSSLEEDFCWGKLVRGGIDVKLVPGSHESVFVDPNVRHLANELAACLPRIQPAPEKEPMFTDRMPRNDRELQPVSIDS
jgi:thioesterase domain-containing protein